MEDQKQQEGGLEAALRRHGMIAASTAAHYTGPWGLANGVDRLRQAGWFSPGLLRHLFHRRQQQQDNDTELLTGAGGEEEEGGKGPAYEVVTGKGDTTLAG